MTWDQSWVVNAGLTSAMVKKEWRAVRKDVSSYGEGDDGASCWVFGGCDLVVPAVRANVCRSEENPLAAGEERAG